MKISRITTMTTLGGMVLLLGASTLAGSEAKEQRGQLSQKDYKFVTEASQGGMAEVQMGDWPNRRAPARQFATLASAW